MRKIKVLQFLSTAYPGGTELSLLSLVGKMDREKFETEVCFFYSEGPLSNSFSWQASKVYHLGFGRLNILRVMVRLYKILKDGRYDLIHIYGLKANIAGRIMGRLAGCRNIVTGLRSIYPGNKKSRLHLFLDRLTLPLVKLYISNSRCGVNFLVKSGYPKAIFKVVHSGIDPEKFCIKRGKIEGKCPVIISIGRLEKVKDHRTLLSALSILAKKGLDFSCLLVGDGSLKRELVELSHRLGLDGKCHFLGTRDDIPELLSISDIFVFSSLFEGLPRAIMEAMAASLPVVATDVGGVSELVGDGVTGILVPPGDGEAMASGIQKLLQDSDLRERMGASGLKKIKEEFSFDEMADRIEKIYIQLALKSSPRSTVHSPQF